MDMEFSRLERIVGIFVILVSMLLMATLVVIGRGKDWFENYITYTTSFKESYNLQENAAVKLFKADIGEVRHITLEKDRVRVRLAILEKYASRIRQDAVAVVESPTLIGSEYVSIIPGSPQAPLIPEQGEIPSREKRSLDDILTEFEVEKTAKLVVAAIQDMTTLLGNLRNPEGPLQASLQNIERTSANIEQIVADLKEGRGPMGTLLKSENLLQQVLSNIEQLGAVLDNINRAAVKAPKAMDLVNENLKTYNAVGQSLQSRVDQARAALITIQKSTDALQVILDNIKQGSTQVPRITTSFRDGVDEIRVGVEEINRVVTSMQRSPLIRGNLPPDPELQATDAQARP
jgi:phospholipid/cholesterol/gamma-HCH transport system substrate-binding protein